MPHPHRYLFKRIAKFLKKPSFLTVSQESCGSWCLVLLKDKKNNKEIKCIHFVKGRHKEKEASISKNRHNIY